MAVRQTYIRQMGHGRTPFQTARDCFQGPVEVCSADTIMKTLATPSGNSSWHRSITLLRGDLIGCVDYERGTIVRTGYEGSTALYIRISQILSQGSEVIIRKLSNKHRGLGPVSSFYWYSGETHDLTT